MKKVTLKVLSILVATPFFYSFVSAEDFATSTAVTSADESIKTVIATTTTKAIAQTKGGIVIPALCRIPAGTVLKKGISDGKNKYVTKLQQFLFEKGYLKVTPNGYFGVGTHNGVRVFQKEFGFMVTGIVGPYSLAKINELRCGSSTGSSLVVVAPKTEETTKKVTGVETVVNPDMPIISSFTLYASKNGGQIYDAKITNADTVSLKASCPSDIVEVKTLVGLTQIKLDTADSVCTKEKYLFLNDANQGASFDRTESPLIFTDRDGIASWFSYDTGVTPVSSSVPVTLKACHASTCVQKIVQVSIATLFNKAVSKELSITDVHMDTSQNLHVSAYNFNHLTLKAGCPYNVQAVDLAGTVLTDAQSPCNVEKDIVADQSAVMLSYEKASGTPLKAYDLLFELKEVNGQTDAYSNVELNVSACTGKQYESVSSTTLRCVEKKTFVRITALPGSTKSASSTSSQ